MLLQDNPILSLLASAGGLRFYPPRRYPKASVYYSVLTSGRKKW